MGTLIEIPKQYGDRLARGNIMRQTANLKDFVPPMQITGIKINTSPTDSCPIQSVQLSCFDREAFKLFGASFQTRANETRKHLRPVATQTTEDRP